MWIHSGILHVAFITASVGVAATKTCDPPISTGPIFTSTDVMPVSGVPWINPRSVDGIARSRAEIITSAPAATPYRSTMPRTSTFFFGAITATWSFDRVYLHLAVFCTPACIRNLDEACRKHIFQMVFLRSSGEDLFALPKRLHSWGSQKGRWRDLLRWVKTLLLQSSAPQRIPVQQPQHCIPSPLSRPVETYHTIGRGII